MHYKEERGVYNEYGTIQIWHITAHLQVLFLFFLRYLIIKGAHKHGFLRPVPSEHGGSQIHHGQLLDGGEAGSLRDHVPAGGHRPLHTEARSGPCASLPPCLRMLPFLPRSILFEIGHVKTVPEVIRELHPPSLLIPPGQLTVDQVGFCVVVNPVCCGRVETS